MSEQVEQDEVEANKLAPPRTRKPDRQQMLMVPCSLDELLPPDHPARIIWAALSKLDLSDFYEPIKAREGVAGREVIDPAVAISLWLLAAVEGVGSGRRLEQLCEYHAAYRWICGGVSVNYHTLNDFRTGQKQALDELFTQVLGRLMHAGLVKVRRITQDGTKVRASAGARSFCTRDTLAKKLAEAKAHIRALGRLADESVAQATERQEAAAQRVAKERLERVERAMEELAKVEAAKAKQKEKPSKHRAAKASSTDPEARMQKMSDGGFRPAYNIQLAQDPSSRAIVGVAVADDSSDKDQSQPMRQQVEDRSAEKVQEHLMDGNYLTLEGIDQAAAQQVRVYAPVPKPKNKEQDRFAARKSDSMAVAAWRERMNSEEGREIYRQRGSTCEPINGEVKCWRGLGRLFVRGSEKVLCVALWSALAYNLMHFAATMP